MNEEIVRSEILKGTREYLYQQGYIETTSQIVRNTDSGVNFRFGLDNGKFLRDCMELPLRKKVSDMCPKVFELGPCFRQEKEDVTHYSEFYLMELFSKGETISDMANLMKGISLMCISDIVKEFKEVSVRDFIISDLGVDISVANTKCLVDAIVRKYSDRIERNKLNYPVVNKYIELFIESTLTEEGCLYFLIDYPICTIAVARRKKQGDNCIQRFECFLNGMELANAFEDCMDPVDLESRLLESNIMTEEEEELLYLVKNKKIASTVGIGVGIDRLCMLYKK